MNKRLNLYFFGEIGLYDEYCPAYVCDKRLAPEILYLIAKNKPFTISKEEIMNTLNINLSAFQDLIYLLKRINLIDVKDNAYKVNFPIFLEEDLAILDKSLYNVGKVIGDIIIRNKEVIYNKLISLSSYGLFQKERLLYHIICDYILDGTAFDYFYEKGLFCVSKIQPGDRNYIAIGYEDSEKVEHHSNKLLCSSNNFRSNSFIFNSFGDSNGNRKDMYRFFRTTQKSLEESTKSQDLNLSYIKILDRKNKEIAEGCGQLIIKILKTKTSYLELTEAEKEIVTFLKELNYVKFNEDFDVISLKVPIFTKSDKEVINEISTVILNEIFDTVRDLFTEFERRAKGLTSFQHGVDMKEVSNELWHQIFGSTNEYLTEVGFVSTPKYIDGEGRYLQSFSTGIS